MLIVLLTSLANASNHTKCVTLSNQKCLTQPTLINLHPNEYSKEFHYYPVVVKLDRRVGSCNTLNDLSNKVCVPNKAEDLNHVNVNVNLMVESVIQIKNGIMINTDASVKNIYVKRTI